MKNAKDIAARRPVDRVAAQVVSKGVSWIPNKRIQTADSDTPLPVATLPG